jgi:hypothetical protein
MPSRLYRRTMLQTLRKGSGSKRESLSILALCLGLHPYPEKQEHRCLAYRLSNSMGLYRHEQPKADKQRYNRCSAP